MPGPDTERPKSGCLNALIWFAWPFVLFIGAVIVFRAVYAVFPEEKPRPSWIASSGEPVPPDFCFAMFPIDNAVPLSSVPDGKPVATLTRAVVNTQEEVAAGGWVQVQDPNGPCVVQLSKLAYLPPETPTTDYFTSFVAAYQAREPKDFRSASFTLQRDPSGITIATLHLKQEDQWQDYIYEVTANRATPLEMYKVFGPGQALKDSLRLLTALAAGVVFIVLAASVLIYREWRKRSERRINSAANR